MRKYRNKKTSLTLRDNSVITFDSKAEESRGRDLLSLQEAMYIGALEFQPEFILQDSFKRNGKTIRAIKYIADFQYVSYETGNIIVEDVKGMKTAAYQMKKKMFLKKYGDELIFREVYISGKKTEIKEI